MAKPSDDELMLAIARTETLHACAEVLSKAIEILNDPDANQMDLVEVIRTDTALTSDIMRISNSAFYGGHHEIASLEDAIHRLGFREVMKLISISLSRQVFNRCLHAYGLSATSYWAECASVAATMECLADLLDEDRSYYFTVGIMHSIGKLILDSILEARGEKLGWNPSTPLADWENVRLGINHAEAGYAVLKSWNFPERLLTTVLHQRNPEGLPECPNALLCLNYAIRWCEQHHQFSDTDIPEPPQERWLIDLEITQADLMDLHSEAREVFLQMKHLVGIH